MDAKAEKLALFRYGLVAPLVLEALPRGELTRRAQEIAARHYDIPDSKRISVSVDTLLDWALRYRTGGFEAVAVWIPPDRSEFSAAEESRLPDFVRELVGRRAPEVTELLRRFGDAHPRHAPHYYLSLLATADEHRGRGLGIALLRENLARIDLEGRPAYLESSNPGNNPRYQSLGFVPVTSFQAPGDGPLVTGMWREGRTP